MNEVTWKQGSRFQVPASIAYEEINKLKDANGDIEPAAIVKAAKRKRHPLHKEFEWDDEIAGAKFREETARKMLRSIQVVYPESPRATPVRSFEVIRQPTKRQPARKVYRSTEEIMRDPELRAQLLTDAFRQLQAFQARFRGLQELAPVFRGIEEALEAIHD